MSCNTFFTEIGFDLVAGDELNLAAFDVVMAVVEGIAHSGQAIDMSGDDVLHQLVRRTAGLEAPPPTACDANLNVL